MSVLPNTEREFPPRETPLAHYSRVMHRAWRVIVCGKLTSLMLDDSVMMKGGFGRRAAVMQSFSPCAAWVCEPAGVLYLELQLPFMSSRLH